MPPEGLSPTDFFGAAFDLLATRGPDALTIANLGGELGVTKGSFYHHFKDLPTFVDALMVYWASEHAAQLIALSESIEDSHERIELLEGIAVSLPHDAEAAIRAWAWSNDEVARVVHRVDEARLAHLTEAGIDLGLSEDRARLAATISLGALIGLQQLERPVRRETMAEVFAALRSKLFAPLEEQV